MGPVPSAGRVEWWADLDSPPERPRSSLVSFGRPFGVCALALLAVGASTVLPWYGETDGISGLPAPFGVTPGPSALSHWLTPEATLPWMRPGGQGWGYLILAWSLAAAAIAAITLSLAWAGRVRGVAVRLLTLLVASASTALVVVVGMALPARPPLGDGPRMVLDWGAVIGLVLAVTAATAGWWALAVCEAGRRSARR